MKPLRNSFKNYVEDMRKLIAIVIIIVCSFNGTAQTEIIKRVTKELCSPKYHGRGYVNNGDGLAAEFIKEEFIKAGLLPIEESYFQQFEFPVNSFPGAASFKFGDSVLAIGKAVLVDPASPNFYGKLKCKLLSPDDLLDEGVLMAKLQDVLSGTKFNAVAIDLTTENSDTLKLLSSFKYELAKFVPVVELTNAKFTWSVAQSQLKHIVVQIKPEFYQDGLPLSVDLKAELIARHQANNVIGYIPAAKKCRHTIVFTAHYDHLGQLGADTYFPGANDNASGTAMLISLANYFREHPSEFNIAFIAFAGEEAGLLGSKYFVDNPLIDLKKIRFLINLDIMGSGEEGVTVVNGSVFTQEFDLLVAINEKEKLLHQIKARGYAANSDHYWFTDAGVPSIFIYTMGPNKNYHDIFDTYDALSFAESDDITILLKKFIEQLPKKRK